MSFSFFLSLFRDYGGLEILGHCVGHREWWLFCGDGESTSREVRCSC